MTTDTHTEQAIASATTDSSSTHEHELDEQIIGRDLFFHRSMYHPYKSCYETNPMMSLIWDVFRKHSRINEYVTLPVSIMIHDVSHIPEAHAGDRLDEGFKYIARRVSRILKECDQDYEASEIHDFREAGVTMDLDRAEELCRKMMEK